MGKINIFENSLQWSQTTKFIECLLCGKHKALKVQNKPDRDSKYLHRVLNHGVLFTEEEADIKDVCYLQ
jgi:hypothetical protein